MTNTPRQPLLPASQGETTLGVLGGGQLGRMFVHAAQQMGYFTAVLDPDPTSPAGRVSHHHIQTDYLDPQGLAELSRLCSAVTTEFENVPAQALATLAEQLPVAPAASAVSIAQDRAREKAHFVRCGVPCAPYAVIETEAQLAALDDAALLPGILKTARMGYDGKGQVRVKTRAELAAAWQGLKQVPCVLEKMLPLAAECSVIVARDAAGQQVNFPVQRNLHRDGILAVTEVFEGNVSAAVAAQAVAAARSVAQGLDYVGVLCASSSCCRTARWWSTRSPPARTTAVTTRSTPATCRSSTCRCGPWSACPWCSRACTAPPSCSTCWAICGSSPAATSNAPRPGTASWPCPARTCTCTASWRPSGAARWGT